MTTGAVGRRWKPTESPPELPRYSFLFDDGCWSIVLKHTVINFNKVTVVYIQSSLKKVSAIINVMYVDTHAL